MVSEPLSPTTLQDLADDLGIDPLVLERDWVLTEIIFQSFEEALVAVQGTLRPILAKVRG